MSGATAVAATLTPKQVHVLLPAVFRGRDYGLALTLYQDALNCLESER